MNLGHQVLLILEKLKYFLVNKITVLLKSFLFEKNKIIQNLISKLFFDNESKKMFNFYFY